MKMKMNQEEETSAVSNISGHISIECAIPCVSIYDLILCSAAKVHVFTVFILLPLHTDTRNSIFFFTVKFALFE